MIIIATALACLIISAIIGTTAANLVTWHRDRRAAEHQELLNILLTPETWPQPLSTAFDRHKKVKL